MVTSTHQLINCQAPFVPRGYSSWRPWLLSSRSRWAPWIDNVDNSWPHTLRPVTRNHPVSPTCVVCNLTKGVNKFSVFFVFLQVSFAFFCLEKSVPTINLWNGDFLGKHAMAQVNIGKVWKTCIPRICKRKCKASRNACRPPSQVKMDQLIQGCVPHVSLPKVRYVQV